MKIHFIPESVSVTTTTRLFLKGETEGVMVLVVVVAKRRTSLSPNRARARRRSYSRSEVIHRAGDESIFPAFERERPRIVNNFAASASSGYELSSFSER